MGWQISHGASQIFIGDAALLRSQHLMMFNCTDLISVDNCINIFNDKSFVIKILIVIHSCLLGT